MPSAPKVPKPPTPGEQIEVNRQTASDYATLSHQDSFSPYGSLTYTKTGTDANGLPIYSGTTSLSPQQQALLNILQGTQAGAGADAASLIDAGDYGAGAPDLSMGANSIVRANMENFADHHQPFFERDTSNLDNQLRNQGLMPGTEAYNNQMAELKRTQGNTVSGYLASMQPHAFQQAVTGYEQPLKTGLQLASLGRPASLPNELAPMPQQQQTAPPNLSQMYQGQMAGYNAQMGQHGGMMNGLFGTIGNVLPFLL